MMMTNKEQAFDRAKTVLLSALVGNEQLNLSFDGEEMDYIRFNKAKLRQATRVDDGQLSICLMDGQKQITSTIQLTHSTDESASLERLLSSMRQSLKGLPDDPYIVWPQVGESSRAVHRGELADGARFVEDVLGQTGHLDVVGIQQSGTSFRGTANSKGLTHWFETDSFATDYSIFHPNGKAVKGTFAGSHWDGQKVREKLNRQATILDRLGREPMKVPPGKYRVYLEPAATADLVGMLSYYGVSESCIRQGESPFVTLVGGGRKLSEKFSVTEDFTQGLVPRFNDNGELAANKIEIFRKGTFTNSLIAPRTAAEYGLKSNGANAGESLRTPVAATGTLDAMQAIRALGTGIYLSNLHYLNWSDIQGARVTGMTRYACMWVENGELIAPIVDMRFDESLFDCFGANLEDCTTEAELIPNTGSYGGRDLGGCVVPGMLIKDFTFTL